MRGCGPLRCAVPPLAKARPELGGGGAAACALACPGSVLGGPCVVTAELVYAAAVTAKEATAAAPQVGGNGAGHAGATAE